MRKSKKLWRSFNPQIIAILLIAAALTISASQAGAVGKIISARITDKYGDVVTVKTNSGNFTLDNFEAKKPEPEESKETAPDKKTSLFKSTPKPLKFDNSVNAALAKMDLSQDAITTWTEQHTKSALKELEKMSPAMQTKVANIATFIRSVNGKLDKKTAWREAAAIVHFCSKYNISTELAVGVAKTESNFEPHLTSKAGARGVMQVMWKYHSGMLQAKGIASTKEQLHDPERGIESGILLLSRYVETYGSIQKALNRYYGKVSTTYAKKVNNNVAMLQNHSAKTGF